MKQYIPFSRIFKTHLYIVFILAFMTRLFVLIIVDYPFPLSGDKTRSFGPQHDSVRYDQLALSLMDGEGMKSGEPGNRIYDLRRPIFYPLFLATIYKIFGYDIFFVHLLQILIGVLSVILFYLLCLEYFNEKISFISATIFALYLPHGIYSIQILTEIWTTFFLIYLIFTITKAYKSKLPYYWFFSGIIYALLILNRQVYKFAWVFILAGLIILYYENRRVLLKNLIYFLVPFLLLTLPWIWYVKTISGKFQFDTLNIHPIALIYGGILQTQVKIGEISNQEKIRIEEEMGGSFLYADEGELKRKAITYIKENPQKFTVGILYRINFLLLRSFFISQKENSLSIDTAPYMKKKYFNLNSVPILIVNLLTVLFSIAGIFGFINHFKSTLPIAITVFLTIATFSIMQVEDRYGHPIHQFLILYSVLGIELIYKKFLKNLGSAKF